jgi:hypothetical protein
MVLYTENLYHSNTKAKDVAGHSHIDLLIAQKFCSPYPSKGRRCATLNVAELRHENLWKKGFTTFC